jgi:uncharacterized protein YkwD
LRLGGIYFNVLLFGIAATALALSGAPSTPSATTGALAPRTACRGQSSTAAAAALELRAMRCLINWARRHAGEAAVADNAELDQAALLRARDIRRCQDFSHTPCGQPFITVFTVVHYFTATAAVGENLAWGEGRLGSPRSAMASWLASPPHRAILFTAKWRDLGLARVKTSLYGRSNVSVWVAQFGRRGLALPLP